jgi:hypothetical protein
MMPKPWPNGQGRLFPPRICENRLASCVEGGYDRCTSPAIVAGFDVTA